MRYALIAALLTWAAGAQAQPAATIVLPDQMAVTLPPGATEVAASDGPLKTLLDAARSGARTVTNDVKTPLQEGATAVTWTAWDGAPGQGHVVAKRTATVFVLPAGLTQVGVSADENATAGNNATHIARDSQNRVHMVWVDSGRPGAPTGPVYRRIMVDGDGVTHFETPPTYLNDATPGDWNAYPSLTATGDTVYAVWQGGGTARVRRLSHGPSGYAWDAVRNTGARSDGRDVGPAILARGEEVQIVTPDGLFAISGDGGKTWKTETIPLPAGQHMKTASLAADPSGGTIVAFSNVVRDTKEDAKDEGSAGYWQLRTIRRTPDGTWTGGQDALAGFAGWGQPTGKNDALADWVHVATDSTGGTHLTWHGTAISHIYGHDRATYTYRPKGGAWHEPVTLLPSDPARGILYSFAPSLSLDGETAIAGVFYDVYDGTRWAGFDADLVPLRDGVLAGSPMPLTRFVRASIDRHAPAFALSSRFPALAPAPFHTPDGHVWFDVLETFIPVGVADTPKLLVHQRIDVTGLVKP